MPYPISLAHKLAKQLTKVRKDGTLTYLRPDGKSQVSVEYDENNKPVRLEAVVLSTQHDPDVTQEQIHEDIKKYVFDPILPKELIDDKTKFFINPTGRFVIGGPHGDAGLTGRKIIVDTYGGYARHGGGAFSGKDCTKVDRSAAYAARYVAKNIVAAGLADKCEIQLSYAIGVAQLPPSWWTPLEPESFMRSWWRSSARTSTCARQASSRCWICAARSTSRPRLTATSAETIWICLGEAG